MRPFLQYLKYCFTSGHQHGFGIHSPYLYHLVTVVIEEDLPYYKYSLIEKIRTKMCKTTEKIGVFASDGSKSLSAIRSVVNDYAIEPKYGQLLFRLVNAYKPEAILEYGATCGISTMYMAAPNSKTPVYSITSQPEMADLAQSMCERVAMHNIKRVDGGKKVNEVAELMKKLPDNDFFYINSASPSEVLELVRERMDKCSSRFFIVVPTPYATKDMWQTWQTLIADKRVKQSINIFRLGILIANKDLQKEDYILRF